MSATDIAAKLADRAQDVCEYLLPNGVRKGRDWMAGGVEGHAGQSLKVCLSGSKQGQWADFSGDNSGDMVGLWMACREVDVATALREAEDFLGIERRPRTNGNHVNGHATHEPEREVCVAPDDVPSFRHSRYGDPSTIWTYRDPEGRILGYVCRFDPPGERKQIIPRTYSLSDGWQWKGWNKPRPLYGLDRLAARPAAPVLVVEGEKSADAGSGALSAYVVVSWLGGCPGVPYADWTPLTGRNVAFWPDADDAGRAAARAAAVLIGEPVRMIDPEGMPDGWDVADAVADGMTPGQIIDWCKARVRAPELFLPERPPLVTDHQYTPDHPDMIEDVPEPLDVFRKPALPALHKRMLPAAIADYVFDQSEVIGSDPCILAIASLVASASLIHDDIRLQPKYNEHQWWESARLWGAIVGDPSTKKTPPISRAVSHVKKIDIDLSQQSEMASEAYRVEMKVHAKIETAIVEKRAKGEKGSDLHPEPKRPPSRRALVQDITTEKLAEVMADNPGGVLALYDELSGWFGAMDAYRSQGSKDNAFWLLAYNGGSMRVDRKTAGSSILVSNVSACVLGGIQPDPMRAQASKMVQDGLLQRFMVVCAQAADPIGQDRPADREAIENYRGMQDRLSKAKGNIAAPVMFSDAARAVFVRAMKRSAKLEVEAEQNARLRAHAGKLSGLFVRLCLTYHAMDCCLIGEPIGPVVHEQTAESVESFIFDFLLGHMRHFYDEVIGDSTAQDHIRWIAGHILARQPEQITNTTIFRAYRAWRGTDPTTQRAVMAYLESAGWITPKDSDNRGQPTRTWIVNQRVHQSFQDRAVIERARVANQGKAAYLNAI